ncbi:MAG: ABC transporter substrate-binding protein [Faecalibacterium sp.]
MKMISRRSFLKGSGATAVALTAAACSSSSSSTSTSTSTATSTTTDAVDYSALLAEFDDVAACIADWGNTFDATVNAVYTEADLEYRVQLMHEAEDMVMNSHCIMPVYFYVDTYLLKDYVTGMINTVFGMKQYGYCENTNTPGMMNICLASEPDYLDCRLSSSVDGGCMNTQLYAGLMGTAADGSTVLNCAESYEVSEDGYTYTFKLRDDLKWSDGEKLDANDFVYSWNAAASDETGADYGYLFTGIMAVADDGTLPIAASEDGLTFTVTLSAVCPYFLDLCAFPTFFPVPQKYVDAANADGLTPGKWAEEAPFVTNGPYTITAWDHDVSITLEKNEHFFGAADLKMDTLNFMLSDDDTAIYAAYNAGNIDFAASVPVDEIAGLLESSEYHIDEYLGTYYVAANVNSPLFDAMTEQQACACRKGISMMIDRPWICDTVGQSGQIPANCFVSAGCSDGNGGIFRTNTDTYTYPWSDDAGENLGYFDPYNIDYDAAFEYLAAAGLDVADGVVSGLGFEYLLNTNDAHQAIAECIQQDMAVVGIEVTIASEEWAVFLETRKNGDYDIARNGWVMDYNDPVNELEMWLTASGNNDIQFGK